MVKNDTLGFDDESNKKNRPGCDSGTGLLEYCICFVLLLQQFGTC